MDRSADGGVKSHEVAGRGRRLLGHGALVLGALVIGALTMIIGLVGVAATAGLMAPSESGSGGSSEPFTAEQFTELQGLAAAATVRVAGDRCGVGSVGTGFAVDGVLVTSGHLVSGATSVRVDGPGAVGQSGSTEVGVSRISTPLDLAELDGWSTMASGPLGGLSRTEPVVGQRVLLVGYGGGQQLRYVEASVHLVVPGQAYGIDGMVVLIDGPSGAGFSGGPVLNGDGAVVAVLKGIDQATGLTVAVSIAMLDEASLFIQKEHESAPCEGS